MEPPWWPEQELRNDRRFKKSAEDGYLDYSAILSIAELREIHERFKSLASFGIYECKAWQDIIRPMIIALNNALYGKTENISHFNVCVFEWESGLD